MVLGRVNRVIFLRTPELSGGISYVLDVSFKIEIMLLPLLSGRRSKQMTDLVQRSVREAVCKNLSKSCLPSTSSSLDAVNRSLFINELEIFCCEVLRG